MYPIPYKRIIFLTFAVFLVLVVWMKTLFFDSYKNSSMILGASFDPEYAGSLNIDPQKAFSTILNEWNFKYLRLPAHWDKIEKERGQYDFAEVDYYMNEAGKHGAKVILAVGNKTPRWPECHVPKWSDGLPDEEFFSELKKYVSATVERYRNHPALEMWQVENEPFLAFGHDCVRITPERLKEEIAMVKSLDPNHPTLVSDTGELSLWMKTGRAADFFGTTLYRVVWNQTFGYWRYDWVPPAFYRWKLRLVGRDIGSAFVSELQGEAWAPDKPLTEVSIEEQKKSMDINRLKKNIQFAEKVGVPRAYLWGAEWWVWLRERGQNEIPDYVGTLNR